MKQLATILGSALLGATGVIATTNNEVAQLREEKAFLLQDNIWKDVRLGEIPEWNPSIVSSREMTDAYVKKVNEKNAITNPNLWEGLREKATIEGVTCKI